MNCYAPNKNKRNERKKIAKATIPLSKKKRKGIYLKISLWVLLHNEKKMKEIKCGKKD